MNRIKRCKPYCYVDKNEYKCIYEEQVNSLSKLTNINDIMNNNMYMDFADDVSVHGNQNEKVIRKVYAKNSYKGINIGKGTKLAHINIDRNEILAYMKTIQAQNPQCCFNILGIDHNKIALEIHQKDLLPKVFEVKDIKEGELRKKGYEIVAQFHKTDLDKVINFMRGDNFWNMYYIITHSKNTHYIWANPNTSLLNYADRYTNKGMVITEFSHTQPYYICQYIKSNLRDRYFNIEKVGKIYNLKIRAKEENIDEEIAKYTNLIEEYKFKIEELKQRKELENKFPRMDEEYYFIDDSIYPSLKTNKRDEKDIRRIEVNNVFETYQECYEVCQKIRKLIK